MKHVPSTEVLSDKGSDTYCARPRSRFDLFCVWHGPFWECHEHVGSGAFGVYPLHAVVHADRVAFVLVRAAIDGFEFILIRLFPDGE